MVTIRKATNSDEGCWNTYVNLHPFHSPYHLFYWQKAVKKAYQHQSHYLIAEENGNIVGIFPLVIFSTPLGKKNLCALPFCDVGGILADSNEVETLLFDKSKEVAKQYKAAQLELRASYTLLTGGLPTNCGKNGEKVRMLMPLPDSSEALFSSFKSKLRSQIRKAEKNGLCYELGSKASMLDDFYEVFAYNMKALGSPVHAKKWFIALQQAFKENMLISVVYKDKLAIGAGIVLVTGNKASIPWASTKAEFNRLAPNMMLYWSFLKQLSDDNITEFDFGRSSYGEGTFKFKQQWGAQSVALDWQTIDLATSQVAKSTNQTGRGKLRVIVESIWRKLPIQVTMALGPMIRKYISL